MTDLQETGAALELTQATDQLTAALALQATAPSEEHEAEVRRALGNYVTALGSNSTKMLAGGLVGVYQKLDYLTKQFGSFAEQSSFQRQAYNQELDEYREQHKSLLKQNQDILALVEERTRPLAGLPERLATLETGQQQIAARLDADEGRLARKRERLDGHDKEIAELRTQMSALAKSTTPHGHRQEEELRAEVRRLLFQAVVFLTIVVILVNAIGGWLLWK